MPEFHDFRDEHGFVSEDAIDQSVIVIKIDWNYVIIL